MNHYYDTENYKVITTVGSIKMWDFEKYHKHEPQERRNTGTQERRNTGTQEHILLKCNFLFHSFIGLTASRQPLRQTSTFFSYIYNNLII